MLLRSQGRCSGGAGSSGAGSAILRSGHLPPTLPWPPSHRWRIPPRRAHLVGVAGPPRETGAACLAGGGGDEGRPVDRSPGGRFRPEPSLCPPRVSNGHRGVMGGAAPILFWCAAACRPRAWAARRSGALVRARGSRQLGALGRAVCRSSCAPPPRRGPFWGGGGRPLGSGNAEGWRSCGPQAGGGAGGGGAPPPPAPSGVGLPSVVSGAPLWGRLMPWGLPGSRGRWARPGWPPIGHCGWGGREGGSDPLALVRAPAFPRPASEGAALCAPSWAPPVRRRSPAGRAGACGRFTGGACRGRGAPPPRVQRPLRGGGGAAVSSACLRPLLGLRGRGGGEGGALWSPGAAP